jgi:hypothetical protein
VAAGHFLESSTRESSAANAKETAAFEINSNRTLSRSANEQDVVIAADVNRPIDLVTTN